MNFHYGDGTVASGGSFYDSVKLGSLEVQQQLMIQVGIFTSAGAVGLIEGMFRVDIRSINSGRCCVVLMRRL